MESEIWEIILHEETENAFDENSFEKEKTRLLKIVESRRRTLLSIIKAQAMSARVISVLIEELRKNGEDDASVIAYLRSSLRISEAEARAALADSCQRMSD